MSVEAPPPPLCSAVSTRPVFVVLTVALSLTGTAEPQPSVVGIVLLVLAAGGMPWLAREKRRLAVVTAHDGCFASRYEVTISIIRRTLRRASDTFE